MIKAILFDLDGTLLDRDRSLRRFVNVQHDRLNHSLSHILKAEYVSRFIELDCRGRVWKDKVYQDLVEEFDISNANWEGLLEDYVAQFQYHCIPFDGLGEMLERLKQAGYLLGIVTNGHGEFQRRSIDGLGIRNYFNTVVVSEEQQLRKPQIGIFRRALDTLNVQACESIFIGDNLEADVVGAKNAGMKAIWKHSYGKKKAGAADAIVDRLDKIPLIIRSLESQ